MSLSGASTPPSELDGLDIDDDTILPFETISDLLKTGDRTTKGEWSQLRHQVGSPGQTAYLNTTSGEGIMPFETLSDLMANGGLTMNGTSADGTVSLRAMAEAKLVSPPQRSLDATAQSDVGPLLCSAPNTPEPHKKRGNTDAAADGEVAEDVVGGGGGGGELINEVPMVRKGTMEPSSPKGILKRSAIAPSLPHRASILGAAPPLRRNSLSNSNNSGSFQESLSGTLSPRKVEQQHQQQQGYVKKTVSPSRNVSKSTGSSLQVL